MSGRKVLFALGVRPDKIGGMEVFATELARQLKEIEWELTMVFEGEAPDTVRAYLTAPGNVTLEVQPDQTAMDLASNRRFFGLLRKHRPRAIAYSLGGVVRLWPLLGRLTGVRRAVYYDQSSRTAAAIGYRASAGVKMLMKPVDAQVCAAEFVQRCSDGEGIIPRAKSQVIYNSIDTKRTSGPGAEFRREYGIPEDRTVVLQVSWLVPDKGIDVGLRAAKRALAERPDLHFVFCGDGEYRAEYERLAEELGVAGHVTWTGQVRDLFGKGAYAAADLLMQCSQWHEACPYSVAEAMSAGLAVVGARIGGIPELVIDGHNGLLFDPPSDAELAEAILRLAGDEALRRRMGEAGRARAVANHEITSNVAKWVKLLTEGL